LARPRQIMLISKLFGGSAIDEFGGL